MYGVCYLSLYQHTFLREGKKCYTNLFRNLEYKELTKDWDKGEVVNVKGIFQMNTDNKEYPIPLYDTTTSDMKEILDIIEMKKKEKW